MIEFYIFVLVLFTYDVVNFLTNSTTTKICVFVHPIITQCHIFTFSGSLNHGNSSLVALNQLYNIWLYNRVITGNKLCSATFALVKGTTLDINS